MTRLRTPKGLQRIAQASVLATAVLLMAACATHPPLALGPGEAYDAVDTRDVFTLYAPVIVPQEPRISSNRIGRPSARLDDGHEEVYVDPRHPDYYVQQREFSTAKGSYTNLIYRVHFERVPYTLIPFHLTAGKNGGLFVIFTLDENKRPLLITTVHTCGCYLAFVPTSYLGDNSLPVDWPEFTQKKFGEILPARLYYPDTFSHEYRTVIYLRSGTHRVMDIQAMPQWQVETHFQLNRATVVPMDALHKLPVGDGTTSFFHESGRAEGYVKNAVKPFEFLFMSWWTLDPRIGVDKDYGDAEETGTVFYTSLKPWARDESDMWQFADFLAYWGWRL